MHRSDRPLSVLYLALFEAVACGNAPPTPQRNALNATPNENLIHYVYDFWSWTTTFRNTTINHVIRSIPNSSITRLKPRGFFSVARDGY